MSDFARSPAHYIKYDPKHVVKPKGVFLKAGENVLYKSGTFANSDQFV